MKFRIDIFAIVAFIMLLLTIIIYPPIIDKILF